MTSFRQHLISLLAFVSVASNPLYPQSESAKEPTQESLVLIERFQALGINDLTSKALAKASLDASEDDVAPLLPFIDSDEPTVAFAAAILAVATSPETAVPRVRAAMESPNQSGSFLPIALALDPSVSNVNYLVGRLGQDGGKSDSALMCGLMILTRETHAKPELWLEWWKKNRGNFAPDLDLDEEELMRRIQTSVSLYRIDAVSKILRAVHQSEPLLANLSGMFDRMRQVIEDGARIHLSPEAMEADKLLVSGSLEEAMRAYANAASIDPQDLRSSYLQACLLLEVGKHTEAAERFESIAKARPEITSAVFLAKLSQRRGSAGASDWVTDAMIELGAMKHIPEPELFGWPDPLIEIIIGQAMSSRGPFVTDYEQLDTMTTKYPADVQIALGAALSGPKQEKNHRLAVAGKLFPDNPAIASALAQQHPASEKNLDQIKDLTQTWMRIEPLNAVPALREIELENWLPSKRFADEASVPPLSETTLDALARAINLPEINDGGRASVLAISHTLSKMQAPFSIAALNGRPPMEVTFQVLSMRILLTAKQLFSSGQIEEGERVARLGISMGKRRAENAETLISYVMATAQWMMTTKALRDAMEIAGKSEVVAEMDAMRDNQKKKLRRFKRTEFLSLVTLPVPSLQRAMMLRMNLDGIRLVDEWIALRPEN